MKVHYYPAYDAYIRYQDFPGYKTTVVFLHGLGCASSSDYPTIAAQLAAQGYRCLLVDLLGAGFSDHPADFGYSVTEHAQAILALVNSLELKSFALVGHSAGGAVAITLASLCDDRVVGLVLAEPNLIPGGGLFSRSIAVQVQTDYIDRGYALQIQQAVETNNHIWSATMAVASPIAVYKLAQSLVEGTIPSWREQLLRFSFPTIVLFGEYSLPDADFDLLPTQGINVACIADAGHSMMWENPLAVAENILCFLGSLSAISTASSDLL